MECYSAIKKNETGSFVETWMDLETVIQSEVSQKQKNKYILTHMFTAALFTIAKIWKQSVSIDRQMDKEDVVYIYTMEYYSAMNDILLLVTTWTDLECIMLSEISQTEKNKYHMIYLYVESKNPNKRTNKEQKQTHRYRKQTSFCQRGGGQGEGQIGEGD